MQRRERTKAARQERRERARRPAGVVRRFAREPWLCIVFVACVLPEVVVAVSQVMFEHKVNSREDQQSEMQRMIKSMNMICQAKRKSS